MPDPFSLVASIIGLIDVSIRALNAAATHWATVKGNKNALSELLLRYQALLDSVWSFNGSDRRLSTVVWVDALNSMCAYFTHAGIELAKLDVKGGRKAARRWITPREAEGILTGLMLRLRHVELLVVNLDGFANVGLLLDSLRSGIAGNQQSLVDLGVQMSGITPAIRNVGESVHAKLDKIEHLILTLMQIMPSDRESLTLNHQSVAHLLQGVEQIVQSSSTSDATADVQPSTGSDALSSVELLPIVGSSSAPSNTRLPLNQDAVNTRYKQMNPKIVRVLHALQNGSTPPDDKRKALLAIGKLLEPWKVDPSRLQVSYGLIDEIGAGGFARVYKGILDNCTVAVKVLNKDLVDETDGMKADFFREATLMSELRHPCILEFLGAYWPDDEAVRANNRAQRLSRSDNSNDEQDDSRPDQAHRSRAFILTELMDFNIKEVISKRILVEESDLQRALCDVAEALYFMHKRGVVHMDVKAENVLVVVDDKDRLDGRAKLADFGVSKQKRDTAYSKRLYKSSIAGTRAFMSPELLLGKCGAEKACDVWSFGALMCSVLCKNRCPLLSKSEADLERAAEAHTLHGEMARWASTIGNERLRSLAVRCLSDNPLDRPSFNVVLGVLEWEDVQVTRILTQARCFCTGSDGLQKDETKAVELYKRGSDAGDATAMFNLGICFRNGKGVARDDVGAANMFRRAARAGVPGAMVNLGICYATGSGVNRNYIKAAELYQRAADADDSGGIYNLGVCYEKGTGVGKNYSKAVRLYESAASKGVVNALHSLGVCYRKGRGVPMDENKAREFLQRATDAGYVDATRSLTV
jgi:serine/threonine protein kinase